MRIAGDVKKRVGLVGKGVTFDCGGYNIKAGPGCMIEMMKFDSELSPFLRHCIPFQLLLLALARSGSLPAAITSRAFNVVC